MSNELINEIEYSLLDLIRSSGSLSHSAAKEALSLTNLEFGKLIADLSQRHLAHTDMDGELNITEEGIKTLAAHRP